jgi:cellulose synthase/poly-beta-1,6-N-acetylglucosamine synthase-like glycosyltransferase
MLGATWLMFVSCLSFRPEVTGAEGPDDAMNDFVAAVLAWALIAAYLLVVSIICVYGVHRWWLLWTLARSRRVVVPEMTGRLPSVTVQLPMFNEAVVAERVIEAAAGIDYPRELLEIQVLDDSTNECAAIARACCDRLRAGGTNVAYLHRDDRTGFKAGALESGLHVAKGELLAIFDADFVPPADMLRRIVPEFADENVGMVQARWTHLNRDDSILTRAQAMLLDGHFVIEQTARARAGRWFNFNGTAGLWRKACIVDAGGWQHDTLTEDTDLSYRAQLRGWMCRYRPDIECPAEVPPTVRAFLSQQHRWNKGLIQTAKKLLGTILKSDAPLGHKVEAWFHLTSPLVHLLMLLLITLIALTSLAPLTLPGLPEWPWMMLGILFLVLGTVAASAFYVASQRQQGRSLVGTILMLPVLMAVGAGVSVANSRAVIEALAGLQSPFVRTPKFNGSRRGDLDPAAKRKGARVPTGSIETVLGVLLVVGAAVSFNEPVVLASAPFVMIFAAGYLCIGVGALCRR